MRSFNSFGLRKLVTIIFFGDYQSKRRICDLIMSGRVVITKKQKPYVVKALIEYTMDRRSKKKDCFNLMRDLLTRMEE